jgi:hypothetical protein
MKYFNLSGTIDDSILTRFLDFYNQNNQDEITIVIDSGGGRVACSNVILSIVNDNPAKFTLLNIGSFSSAFCIFYYAKCKKLLSKGSIGMIHMAMVKDVIVDERGKYPYPSDECNVKNAIAMSDKRWCRKFMTEKEFSDYKKGKDVYFTFKRMKEIFPAAKTIGT